jgi:5'-3' exonuclease
VQLLSILPPESVELLPRSAQKFMTDPSYGCMHLFPQSYQIQTYLKVHLWECTPVLPPLDVDLLEKLIDKKD